MEPFNAQVSFFQHIKNNLPPHLSLVDEVADLLKISNDSAYRRIRGEKPIALEEIQKLATHFKISLDQFLHLQSDSFLFTGKLANSSDHVFEKWLESTLQQMTFMNSFPQKHVYYLAKDIPLMQQFQIPELIAFKSFFWRKSILHYEDLRGQKFSFDNVDPRHLELGKKIAIVYGQIPSTEIWNIESINTTIRQIEFYRDAKGFVSEEDVAQLYKSLIKLIDHIERQAELGLKFGIGEVPKPDAVPFSLYNNELILGDNSVLADLGTMKVVFLNHSVINFIATRDERFTAYMFEAFQNLVKKSTQLSHAGERERTRFFNRIRDKMKLAARL
jgi:hypothetical protein